MTSAASAVMAAQFRVVTRLLGVSQDPPTQATFANAR
jgi:hypothetical protein